MGLLLKVELWLRLWGSYSGKTGCWFAKLAEKVDVVIWDTARGTGHWCFGSLVDCVLGLTGMLQLGLIHFSEDALS